MDSHIIHRIRCLICFVVTVAIIVTNISSVYASVAYNMNGTLDEGVKRLYQISMPIQERFDIVTESGQTTTTNYIWVENGVMYTSNLKNERIISASLKFRRYNFVSDLRTMSATATNNYSTQQTRYLNQFDIYYKPVPDSNDKPRVDGLRGLKINSENNFISIFQSTLDIGLEFAYTDYTVNFNYTGGDFMNYVKEFLDNNYYYRWLPYDESESGQSKSIIVSPDTIECEVGDTVTFNAAINPSTLAATWSSTAPAIGQISSSSAGNGVGQCKITAKAVGQTSVYLKSNDGSVSGVGTLIVKPKSIQPTSISLNQSALSLKSNQTSQLTATVQPTTATDKTVRWSSDDSSIASVSQTGLVTAKIGRAHV